MIGEEEIAEVADTLRSGWVTTGPKSARFEEALKAFNEVPHCLALLNATTGLEMTLGALGIGPGDEVITTAHTFVCTVSNVVLRGAVPVLVDVEPDTMNVDAERIEERITPRTKAILPVHYGGLPCRLERIWEIAERHGVAVIEDAAHTMGARYAGRRIGSSPRSAFSVYSFHPNKNMTTIEGGAVAFHDAAPRGVPEAPALPRHRPRRGNALRRGLAPLRRPDAGPEVELHGRAGRRRPPPAPEARRLRGAPRRAGAPLPLPPRRRPGGGAPRGRRLRARALLEPLRPPQPPRGDRPSREELIAALKAENVGTGVHWQGLFGFSFYRDYFAKHPEGLPKDGLPHATRTTENLMSLPLWPGMTEDDVLDVAPRFAASSQGPGEGVARSPGSDRRLGSGLHSHTLRRDIGPPFPLAGPTPTGVMSSALGAVARGSRRRIR